MRDAKKVKRTSPVKKVQQDTTKQIDSHVQNVKQTIPVQNVKQPAQIDDPDFAQVHFAITIPFADKTRRTTVMLENYLVRALQRHHGLAGNTAIRAWIEKAVKDDKFDSNQATTKQVKRLIIESFV